MPPPSTGETSLSAATPVSLGLVWTVSLALGAALCTAAVAHYRVALGEKHADAQDLRLDAGEARSADMEARMRLQEEASRRREDWEKRVERKLDTLLEGGRTGGHPR